MDKPKKQTFLYAIALVAAVIAIIMIAASGWNRAESDVDNQTDSTTDFLSDVTETTESIIPTIQDPTIESKPPIEAGKDVTITQISMLDGTVIDRSPDVPNDHPEYVESAIGGGPYISNEGKVYKNDRTITIDVFDHDNSEIITYTFGLAIGEYNRFLYINPCRTEFDSDTMSGYFRFTASGGYILNIPPTYDSTNAMNTNCHNFSIRRAMDQSAPAEYSDPKHPGTVWFTSGSINEPIYVDIIAFNAQGAIENLLRLWIDKDENGCYYFASIENRNLFQNKKETPFSNAELYYIYEMAAKDMYDGEKIRLTVVSEKSPEIEDFLYDYRTSGDGCYYPYIIPGDSSLSTASADYISTDIMAVTLRNHSGGLTVTLYYHILILPEGNEHGMYRYIGRDYHMNQSISILQSQGYPGYD